SLFLATACGAGDNLASESSDTASPSESTSPAGSAGGPLTIASQSFSEAALVAEMYKELLTKAGYTPTVKLVSPRDAHMATFPGSVDVVPEYVGGIVNFLNAQANGADAKQFTAGDGQQLAQQGKQLLDKKGITLLNLSSATDTNAFFVTKKYSEDNHVTKLS